MKQKARQNRSIRLLDDSCGLWCTTEIQEHQVKITPNTKCSNFMPHLSPYIYHASVVKVISLLTATARLMYGPPGEITLLSGTYSAFAYNKLIHFCAAYVNPATLSLTKAVSRNVFMSLQNI